MRESSYDLMCAFLLGLGQLCTYTGYDTQLTIVEPVLRTVHNLSPSSINANAGYYGPALCMIVFTFANLAAPWALSFLGSKLSLLLGSMMFSLHIVTFFFIHWIPYYSTAALLGVGFALFNCGYSKYTTEHSSRRTIERNSALTWALGSSCMTVGGIVMLFTIQPSKLSEIVERKNMTDCETTETNRYSGGEIRLMYGAFLQVTVCSNVIFACIPKRSLINSIAEIKEHTDQSGFKQQMKRTFVTMVDKKMLQLTPLFGYIGLSCCIWVSVYPTTLTFSKKLTERLPARVLLHCFRPYLPVFIAVLFGIGYNCLNTSRTVICALILPEARTQVFAVSKFHQSLLLAALTFISPLIPMPVYSIVIILYSVVSVYFYRNVVNDLRKTEKSAQNEEI